MKTYLNLLVVFAILCWQSNTILASEQYHIENLGIMSGLSDGDVLSITQDSEVRSGLPQPMVLTDLTGQIS